MTDDYDNFVDNLTARLLESIIRWVPVELLHYAVDMNPDRRRDLARGVAMFTAESLPPGHGYGTSDFSADMATFLSDLGYKVEVIEGRYTVTGVRTVEGVTA